MAEANHYCVTCETHIACSPETHIDVAHNGGVCQILVNGDYKDWQREQNHSNTNF